MISFSEFQEPEFVFLWQTVPPFAVSVVAGQNLFLHPILLYPQQQDAAAVGAIVGMGWFLGNLVLYFAKLIARIYTLCRITRVILRWG